MNYYNEYDKGAAQWLRVLISAGEIPAGHVDERSIADVRPSDLAGYTQCHFFAGIGGWSYALKLAGWPVDKPVWTGSCPCQPFSSAGKQLGTADARHLWPVFHKLIAQRRPDVVFGEQVEGAVGKGWLDGVCGDLEGEGYACGAAVLGAHSVGAPHIRQRLYWVADSDSRKRDGLTDGEGRKPNRSQAGREQGNREPQCCCSTRRMGDSDDARPQGYRRYVAVDDASRRKAAQRHGSTAGFWGDFDLVACTDGKTRRVEPSIFPLAHGVSGRVGLLRGYGNAIVPQVAAKFIGAYLDAIGGSSLESEDLL